MSKKRIAVCASSTLSGPGEGAVSIISEAIESRVVVDRIKALAEMFGRDTVEIIDCTLDYADTVKDYCTGVVNAVNESKPDIFIYIGFASSHDHYHSGMRLYTNCGYSDSVMRIHMMSNFLGFKSAVGECKNHMILNEIDRDIQSIMINICAVDQPSDVELYHNSSIADYIFSMVTEIPIPSHWYIDRWLRSPRYYMEDGNFADNGLTDINNKKYYFTSEGYLASGFIEVGKMSWLYADPDTYQLCRDQWIVNKMQVYYVDGFWVVLPNPGDMLPVKKEINGITYTFDKNGCVESEIRRLGGVGKVEWIYPGNSKHIVYPYIPAQSKEYSPYDPEYH